MFAAICATLTRSTVLPPMRAATLPGQGALSGHSGYVARPSGHGVLSTLARIYKEGSSAALTGHGVVSATAITTAGESSNPTAVTTVGPAINASPTPGSAGSGNLLTITSGGQIALNGVVISAYSPTAGVTELYYIDHTCWQFNGTNWYGPVTATSPGNSTPVTSPVPLVSLSNNTLAANSASGTTVGVLSVTTGLPSGAIGTGAYTWTFALSGTNAASFQVASGALETAVANLATGTYTFTVTATATGVTGSYTLAVTVTVAAAVTPVISLSNNTLATSSPVGTVVGNLAVTGGSGSYTYAVSGTNAADFKIVGAALEANVANLAVGSYSITITATGTGGPVTLAVTVTVASSTQPTGPTGGPFTLIWSDEFPGTSLDLTKWNNTWESGGAPCGVATFASNVSVSGGLCTLTMPSASSAASIDTGYVTMPSNGFSMPVGSNVIIEVRMMIPGNGTKCYNWGGFWTGTGQNPNWDEVDINEVLGGKPTITHHANSGFSSQKAQPAGYWGGAFHLYTFQRTAGGTVNIWYDGTLATSFADTEGGGVIGASHIAISLGTGQASPQQLGSAGAYVIDYVRCWT